MDDIYQTIEEYNPNKMQKKKLFLIIKLLISIITRKPNKIETDLFVY